MEIPPKEQVHASAVQFLLDGHETESARYLLECSISDIQYLGLATVEGFEELEPEPTYSVTLACSRHAYASLHFDLAQTGKATNHAAAFRRALSTVLPSIESRTNIISLNITGKLMDIDPGWHSKLLETLRGQHIHNQSITYKPNSNLREWNHLYFRSESELRIAKALDQEGVLFFPNCKARLGPPNNRENREPDFLICHDGKWGILEVSGAPFHTASRATDDHDRSRLFKHHGIMIVEHYDANRCFEAPQAVVKDFLNILKHS